MSTKFRKKVKNRVPHTVIRQGIYTFRIAVPKHLREKYRDPKTGKPRTQIWETLDTRDPDEALEKVGVLLRKWRRHFASETLPANDISYSTLQTTSASFAAPFAYQWCGEFLSATIKDLINMYNERYEAKNTMKKNLNTREVAAMVGAIEPPALLFKDAFEKFKKIYGHNVLTKNPTETKRFWRRYEEAVEDFVEEMGDIDVTKIDTVTASEYHMGLVERVGLGEFKADAANKKFMWLRIILDEVFRVHHTNLLNPFRFLKNIDNDDEGKRSPFSEAEIKIIFAALETADLPEEAKAVIKLGACTAAGTRELTWLTAADIHVDNVPIPYISIGKNSLRKKVKTGGDRHRDLPIVCPAALEALRAFPEGFTSFHDDHGPQRMNWQMSKFFRKLIPGKGHYSFRHRLDDLLKNSKCDIGVKASISGHKLGGHVQYYGEGYSLSVKKQAIENALRHADTLNNEINDMTESKQAA
ncbi:DUF6538 domain-containing protein [Ensifer canadensis]